MYVFRNYSQLFCKNEWPTHEALLDQALHHCQ